MKRPGRRTQCLPRQAAEEADPFPLGFPDSVCGPAALRLFVAGKLRFEAVMTNVAAAGVALREMERLVPEMFDKPHLLEFEFRNLPPEKRYLRLGTDASMMVDPKEYVFAGGKNKYRDSEHRLPLEAAEAPRPAKAREASEADKRKAPRKGQPNKSIAE